MASPFPGMDPYLEGHLWPDVHHALATQIRRELTPRLRPSYVARLAVYVVRDESPEAEVGIMYPDVEVLRRQRTPKTDPAGAKSALAAPLTLPIVPAVEVEIPRVEIRDAQSDDLVAAIELLSPVNKREPGRSKYCEKRRRLIASSVHLLEIDLLRRGTRPISHPQLPDCEYLILLQRAGAHEIELWPLALPSALPVVPVPLRAPDPDVPLDLGRVLEAVYEDAAYDLSIDYASPPPPPPLSAEHKRWCTELLAR